MIAARMILSYPPFSLDKPYTVRYKGTMSPKQIKRIRQVLELTQQAMADIIGCRQHTVARWETGEMEPRGANLKALRGLAERAKRKRKG